MKKNHWVLAGALVLVALLFSQLGVSAAGIPYAPAAHAAVTTGPATLLTTVWLGGQIKGVAVNEAARQVYAVHPSSLVWVDVRNQDGGYVATATLDVDDVPNQVAYNPTNNRVYVTLRNSGQLARLDPGTNSWALTHVGLLPWGVATDPLTKEVYVANFGSGTLSDVNGDDGSLISTTLLPPGAPSPAEQPALAAFDSNSGRLYFTGWQTGNLYIVDRARHIYNSVYIGQGAFGVAPAPGGAHMYLTNRLTGMLSAWDCFDEVTFNCVQAHTWQLPSAYAVAFNPHTNHIFVVGETPDGQVLYVMNSQTYQLVQTLALGNANTAEGGQGIALMQSTDRIYVTNYADGTLSVVQDAPEGPTPTPTATSSPTATQTPTTPPPPPPTITPTPTATYPPNPQNGWIVATVPVGVHPKSVAIESVRDRLIYVALFDSSRVQVYDEEGYTLQGSIDTQGLHPNQITRGDKFYVTNRDSNSLSAIYMTGPMGVACRGATGALPWGVAYNPTNQHVYVANYGAATGSGSISVFDTQCTLLKTIPLPGDRPTLMAVLNDKVYVPGIVKGKLYVIDSNDGLTSQLNVGPGVFGIAADPTWNRIYLTNRDTRRLYMIDGGNDIRYITTLPNAGYAVAANPNLPRVYVVGGVDNKLYIVDALYGLMGGSFPIGRQDQNNGGQGLTVNPRTNRVYVTNYADGTMTAFQDVSGPLPKVPLCDPSYSKPILGSVANGTTVTSRSVRLDWTVAFCPSYNIEVRQGSTTGAKVDGGTGLTSTVFTTKLLTAGRTYYWHVRTCDGTRCGAWTGWWRFSVAANAK